MDSIVNRVTSRVQAIMNTAGRPAFPFTAGLLHGLSLGYGLAVRVRADRFARGAPPARTLPCRVVSVGNIAVGGTGKTPMTLYLAQRLTGLGFKVAVASRGYRGRAERRGGIVSDGHRLLLGPAVAGDEPFMMAAALGNVPVLVGRDRYRSGVAAVERFGSQILILDDAFQHLLLARDLDLVLLDAAHPLGNGHLLPRGILREPACALKRAHALVLTRAHSRPPGGVVPHPVLSGKPVFRCVHEPWGCWVKAGSLGLAVSDVPQFLGKDPCLLAGRRVLAFSGLARNHEFQRTVRQLGPSEAVFAAYADHHAYTEQDHKELCRRAREMGADALATTFKDYVKVARYGGWPLDLAVIDIRLSFGEDAHRFDAFLRRFLASDRPPNAV